MPAPAPPLTLVTPLPSPHEPFPSWSDLEALLGLCAITAPSVLPPPLGALWGCSFLASDEEGGRGYMGSDLG